MVSDPVSSDVAGQRQTLLGEGNGPIDAAVHALRIAGIDVQVEDFEERSIAPSDDGGNAQACAFVELRSTTGKPGDHYGVGLDTNIVTASIRAIVTASIRAIVSGINRIQPDVAAVTDIRAA